MDEKKPAIHFLEVVDNQAKMRRLCEGVHHHYLQNHKVLITVATPEVATYVDELLWRHPKESFLPHQIASGKVTSTIAITTKQENVNQAEVLFNLCPNASPIWQSFHTIYELMDKTHPEKLRQSEERKETYRKMGLC